MKKITFIALCAILLASCVQKVNVLLALVLIFSELRHPELLL